MARHENSVGIVFEDMLPESAIERSHVNAARSFVAADRQVEKPASIRKEEWLVQIGLSGIGAQDHSGHATRGQDPRDLWNSQHREQNDALAVPRAARTGGRLAQRHG